MNPMRIKNEGMYRGVEGLTPMTMTLWLVQNVAEGKNVKTSYELGRKVKSDDSRKKKLQMKTRCRCITLAKMSIDTKIHRAHN